MIKKDLYVCSCSFGKDSLAMLLRLLESGLPVDIILFNETGLDFPEMEEHIRKVEEYIKRYTDIGITRLKLEHPFEYYFYDVLIHHRKQTKFNERLGTDSHNGFSWPGPKMRWCTDRLKTRPRTKFLRDYRKEYNIIEYVGIAADEEYRLRRKINDRENMIENKKFVCSTFSAYILYNSVQSCHDFFYDNTIDYHYGQQQTKTTVIQKSLKRKNNILKIYHFIFMMHM